MNITITFVGGCKDGTVFRSDSQDFKEAEGAKVLYFMSKNGQVGKKLMTMSDAGIQELPSLLVADGDNVRLSREPTAAGRKHIYEIVNREEKGDDVFVRFEFRGMTSPK